MSKVTIDSFAKQIGISIEKLLDQLEQAGISAKKKDDLLEDDEKITLLQFLKGGESASKSSGGRISLNRKTKDEIRQTSRTGAARTVHVEVKKRRTFVKRSVLEAQHAEVAAKEAESEAERILAEETAQNFIKDQENPDQFKNFELRHITHDKMIVILSEIALHTFLNYFNRLAGTEIEAQVLPFVSEHAEWETAPDR